jgi:hypothetical protein
MSSIFTTCLGSLLCSLYTAAFMQIARTRDGHILIFFGEMPVSPAPVRNRSIACARYICDGCNGIATMNLAIVINKKY